jgi:hypothetical protein
MSTKDSLLDGGEARLKTIHILVRKTTIIAGL